MPIIQSAKKRLKQSKRNKSRNDHFKALYTESRRAFEKAIKAQDAKTAREVFMNTKDKDGKTIKAWLQAIIDKLVKKNVLHLNNASRKKAKFSKILKTLEILEVKA